MAVPDKAGDGTAAAASRAFDPGPLKNRMLGLAGWRQWALAAALGGLAGLALPPLYAVPLLLPAFTGLAWLIEAAPGPRRAFLAGWWFGFGHALAGYFWIYNPFVVDAALYGWMAPLALIGLAAGLALYPAAVAALARLVFGRLALGPAGRVLVLAALWTAAEWARGWFLTGFSWNLIGTVWVFSPAMIQLAAVTGVYGLSFLTVAAAAMPATMARSANDAAGGRHGLTPLFIAAAALAAVWGGGVLRLQGAAAETVPDVRLRLVQPNIPQHLKWKRELRRDHVLKQLALSRMPPADGAAPPTHVIWAETAVPYLLSENTGLVRALADAAPAGGLMIVGAPRGTAAGVEPHRVWNSLFAIDANAGIAATYDKFHLVPFGEYVPLRMILPINKLTEGRQDFSSGPGLRTLAVAGLPPFSPLICYEAIFPGRVADPARRPGWLLNLTNDAWFGQLSGPYQHFAAARLRAVEEGLPLVRVANTGISGVVDAYGRVVNVLGLGRAGVVDSPLPRSLPPTPYARFGDWMVGFIFTVAMAGAFLLTKTRPRIR